MLSPPKRRRPRSDVRAWNPLQLRAFLETAKSDRLFPAFWLAANTGMRRSELLGLRREDLDLAGAHLSISGSLVSVAYELHESRGKTRNSTRWVDLDPQRCRSSRGGASDSKRSSDARWTRTTMCSADHPVPPPIRIGSVRSSTSRVERRSE